MIEQKIYVVEITGGKGRQWFVSHLHERFLVVVDMKSSYGQARYRVVEDPVSEHDAAGLFLYKVRRFIPEDCCIVIDD
jgi:hypothetical protein